MRTTTPRSFWLTILVFTIIVNVMMTRLTYLRLTELGADLTRSTWSGMLVFCLLLAAACVWMIFRLTRDESFAARFDGLQPTGGLWRGIGGILFALILILIPYLKFKFQIGQDVKHPIYDPILLLWSYYWLCWWLILLAVPALKVAFNTTWLGGFASTLLLFGVTFEIMTRFNVVTDYPFSLGWSEGSRYYYASLLFSRKLYGELIPLSPYHPSRYILQSIPFLFSSVSLYALRLWQFLLWIGLTSGASIILSSRVISSEQKSLRWLFAAWLFLYFLKVGVYYHLQVMVVLTLLFYSEKHPRRSLMGIVLASLWAGISRVNWYVMPALMAIAIYLLETPLASTKKITLKQLTSYFSKPLLWGIVGIVSALIAQAAYISLSGNADNARAFTSSFTSDLLWYRLLPNDSYPTGIVLGILFVSGPLLLGLIIAVTSQWKTLHPIRWAGLFGMIAMMFAGSMVVSVKIGGGGDLHNTDTYAVLIAIIVGYFIGNQVQGDSIMADDWQVLNPALVMSAVIIPILFLIPALASYPTYREDVAQSSQEQLSAMIQEAAKGGPVLMISERQMITVGDLKMKLVPDYEVIILMEMAMSGNQPYLDRFYFDLKNQRFAAIVAGKQNLGIKEDGIFFEENNAWNSLVSPYILCYYEPTQTVETELRSIQIFTPRATACSLP